MTTDESQDRRARRLAVIAKATLWSFVIGVAAGLAANFLWGLF